VAGDATPRWPLAGKKMAARRKKDGAAWLGVAWRVAVCDPFVCLLQYGSSRVPTATSPANTHSSSSSNTGSQSGTHSTSLSNHMSSNLSSGDQLSKTNLYIRGLAPNTTDKDLVTMCHA